MCKDKNIKSEVDIVSENLYGPNGKEVTEFISMLESDLFRKLLWELLDSRSEKAKEYRGYHLELLGLKNRVPQMNRAVEDALARLETFYSEDQRDTDYYDVMQDTIVLIVEKLVSDN